jgi:hypothetical protein
MDGNRIKHIGNGRKLEQQNNSPPLFHFLPVFLYLAVSAALFGQQEYQIREGRFIQILRWQGQENVLYYEVEIERQEGGVWEEAGREKREEPFVEVSLAPGEYRYRVHAYDFLGRLQVTAEQVYFEVLQAKQPEIFRFSPEAFYLDEDTAWVLYLSGRNLTGGVEIYLQNRKSPGNRLIPETVTVEPSENGARLVFSIGQLAPGGEYTVHAVNPGGLETSAGTFRITFRKPVSVNISGGYGPLIPLSGRINELFDTPLFPLGIYARLSVVPVKRLWGYMGIELGPSWNYLHIKQPGREIKAQMAGGIVYGMYQWWFPNRVMALSVHFGGGIYSILDYHFVYNTGKTKPMTALMPAIAGSASFQWFIKKPFFAEAGVDVIHLFTVDSPAPLYLRPFAGAGWQF